MLLTQACAAPDLTEPLQARALVSLDMESLTRAGLFAADPDPDLFSWEVSPADEGRLRVTWPDSVGAAEVTPATEASGALDGLVFDWPDTPGPNHLLALIWFDADGDGAIDLVSAGQAEVVRSIGWREPSSDRYVLTELNWVPELGHAAGRAETDLGVPRAVDASMATGWQATLAERVEPPLQ
jgi:hypothetical protein